MFKDNKSDVCDACGVAGEMGFVIGEGDETITITINETDKVKQEARIEQYRSCALSVNKKARITTQEAEAGCDLIITFEVSAEKIIFELKARSIA